MKVSSPECPEHVSALQLEFQFQGYISATEHRAITLPQLRRVCEYANCNCPRWGTQSTMNSPSLSFNTLNLYDLSHWLIRPATLKNQCAFVELLTFIAQPPLWFVSHWWGERIVDFIRCLEKHAYLRQLSDEYLAYWVCAYANRQHALSQDVAPNPKESSFYKALLLAKGVLLVLDAATDSSGPATPFSRIWCAFEQSVALDDNHREERMLLDIATSTPGEAQLVTDGIVAVDERHVFPSKAKVSRESCFPLEIFRAGLATCLEKAQASNEEDRVRILNCIAGRDLHLSPPLEGHANYTLINHKLRAIFAVAAWRLALDRGLVEDLKLPQILSANQNMRSVTLDLTGCHRFDYSNCAALASALPRHLEHCELNLRECPHLGDGNAATLAEGLPCSLRRLSINVNECSRLGDAGVAAFARQFSNAQLRTLRLYFWGCSRLSDAGVAALSQAISMSIELHELCLSFHGCSQLSNSALAAIALRLPARLKQLQLYFSGCDEVGDEGIAALADGLPHSLVELELRFEGCRALTDSGIAALARRLPPGVKQLSVRVAGTSVSDTVRTVLAGSEVDREKLRVWYLMEACFIAAPACGNVSMATPAIAVADDADQAELAASHPSDVQPGALKRCSSQQGVQSYAKKPYLRRCVSSPF